MSEYLIKKETLDAIAAQSMTLAGKTEAVSTADIITDLTDANAEIETQSELLLRLKGWVDRKTRPLDELIVEGTIAGDLIIDNIITIGRYAFNYCTNLTSVILPVAAIIRYDAFSHCDNLTLVDLPAAEVIEGSAFVNSGSLSIILRQLTGVVELGTGAFKGTSIVSIYVPRALIEEYKTAKNWSNYQTKLLAIEDYPEVCGG